MQPFELPDNQRLAIEALTAGFSRARAASKAGVNVRTLARWLEDPAFSGALHEARRHVWLEHANLLQSQAAKAVAKIVVNMEHPNPGVSLRAAKLLLDLCARNLKTEADLLQAMASADQPQPQSQPAATLEAPAATPEAPPAESPVERGAAKNRAFPDTRRPRRSPLQRPLLASNRLAAQVLGRAPATEAIKPRGQVPARSACTTA